MVSGPYPETVWVRLPPEAPTLAAIAQWLGLPAFNRAQCGFDSHWRHQTSSPGEANSRPLRFKNVGLRVRIPPWRPRASGGTADTSVLGTDAFGRESANLSWPTNILGRVRQQRPPRPKPVGLWVQLPPRLSRSGGAIGRRAGFRAQFLRVRLPPGAPPKYDAGEWNGSPCAAHNRCDSRFDSCPCYHFSPSSDGLFLGLGAPSWPPYPD